jgi:undecaprenyl-diphosphatase
MHAVHQFLELDRAALLWVCRHQRPQATQIFRGVSRLADASTLSILGVAFLAIPHSLTHRLATHLLFAAGGAAVCCQVLKRLLKRPRPSVTLSQLQRHAANPDAFSFPSGHTASAFALATSACAIDPRLGVVMFGLASSIAYSRVYLGVHYPLDVLAGILLGALWGWCCLACGLH